MITGSLPTRSAQGRTSRFLPVMHHGVTDADADRLLGPYNSDEEYPAYRSLTLDRKERRERDARDGTIDSEGPVADQLTNADVAGHAANASLLKQTVGELEEERVEWLISQLAMPRAVKEALRLWVQEGLNGEEIAARQGVSRQTVHRRLQAARNAYHTFQNENPFEGLQSLYLRECLRVTYRRLDSPQWVKQAAPRRNGRVCNRCDGGVPKMIWKDGRQSYVCETCGCVRSVFEYLQLP